MNCRVLIVDDNQTSRSTLRDQMQSAGITSSVAEGNVEALRMMNDAVAGNLPFDVALIDSRLGKTEGRALARAITLWPTLEHTKLDSVRAAGDESDREEMPNGGNCRLRDQACATSAASGGHRCGV